MGHDPFESLMIPSHGSPKIIRRQIFTLQIVTVATLQCSNEITSGRGSAQHEEVHCRAAALGRLVPTASGGEDSAGVPSAMVTMPDPRPSFLLCSGACDVML